MDTGGKVPAAQLPPIPTGPPVGSVAWWPLRSSIPAGQIPADGQTISRATFHDLAAMVAAGTVPVVPEADWLADPLKRGSYTTGDGSSTIRVPDFNGKAAGSLGALFQRGDGAVANGIITRDAMQGHFHAARNPGAAYGGVPQFKLSSRTPEVMRSPMVVSGRRLRTGQTARPGLPLKPVRSTYLAFGLSTRSAPSPTRGALTLRSWPATMRR